MFDIFQKFGTNVIYAFLAFKFLIAWRTSCSVMGLSNSGMNLSLLPHCTSSFACAWFRSCFSAWPRIVWKWFCHILISISGCFFLFRLALRTVSQNLLLFCLLSKSAWWIVILYYFFFSDIVDLYSLLFSLYLALSASSPVFWKWIGARRASRFFRRQSRSYQLFVSRQYRTKSYFLSLEVEFQWILQSWINTGIQKLKDLLHSALGLFRVYNFEKMFHLFTILFPKVVFFFFHFVVRRFSFCVWMAVDVKL